MRPVHAPAKRPTVILRPATSRGSDVIFNVETKHGTPSTGEIEERSTEMFGYKSEIHELRAENRLRIGMLSNGYRLSVIPDQDVTVCFVTSHPQVKDVIKWIAIALGAAICLSILMNVLGIVGPPPGNGTG